MCDWSNFNIHWRKQNNIFYERNTTHLKSFCISKCASGWRLCGDLKSFWKISRCPMYQPKNRISCFWKKLKNSTITAHNYFRKHKFQRYICHRGILELLLWGRDSQKREGVLCQEVMHFANSVSHFHYFQKELPVCSLETDNTCLSL